MAELETYLEYNDPQITLWRSGTDDDPYIPRVDSLPIRDGKAILLEIPSDIQRVNVSGFIEIDQNNYKRKNYLADNEMIVDYSHGIIQFSPVHEGKTFLFNYYGKGLVLIPSSRIYAMMKNGNSDVVVTLQDYINQIEQRITENRETIHRVEELIIETKSVINESKTATDNANSASERANSAADLALDAYNTTRLVFKEPVARFTDIPTTYPSPLIGWTTQTYSDGKRYRFDGSRWIEIDIFGSNLQVVNDIKDGLMSVADYKKLKSFPESLKDRVVTLSLPDAVQGIIANHFSFPFEGEIVGFYAKCITAGETPTVIAVERSRNLVDWTEITNNRLNLPIGSHIDDKNVSFKETKVFSGDTFRLNMTQEGVGMDNITVTFIIRT